MDGVIVCLGEYYLIGFSCVVLVCVLTTKYCLPMMKCLIALLCTKVVIMGIYFFTPPPKACIEAIFFGLFSKSPKLSHFNGP